MPQSHLTGFCLAALIAGVLSHPADLVRRDDKDFIFAAIGDSWAVSYISDQQLDTSSSTTPRARMQAKSYTDTGTHVERNTMS